MGIGMSEVVFEEVVTTVSVVEKELLLFLEDDEDEVEEGLVRGERREKDKGGNSITSGESDGVYLAGVDRTAVAGHDVDWNGVEVEVSALPFAKGVMDCAGMMFLHTALLPFSFCELSKLMLSLLVVVSVF